VGDKELSMNNLASDLKKFSDAEPSWRPVIFNLSEESGCSGIRELMAKGEIRHVIDDYEEQMKELFQVQNPTLVYTPGFTEAFNSWFAEEIKKAGSSESHGRWVFYHWSNTLVHVLTDDEFQKVRTARNRNLITEEEQKRFYASTIGIGGLSVGNSVALAIVLQGGSRKMRLADFDRLGLSNLNRIRAGVDALGLQKVKMTARQIYLLDPYAEIEIFPEGITDANIDSFFDGLDIVIDELDTIPVKLRIREEAKKRSIPVLMGADNGDNAILDIERYDTEDIKYFHGRLGDVTVKDLQGMDKFAIGRTITKMLGAENITERMQGSLLEMGKTIVSWPQLGGAALLNGVGIAYCARKVLTGGKVENNRAILSLDEKLDLDHSLPMEIERRKKLSESFAKRFGL
jgi:ThiF family protein